MFKKYFMFGCILLFCPLKASPLSFEFSQDGFDEGASVTGTFTGDDLNGDGMLRVIGGANELTDFKMEFSGNSIVSSFSIHTFPFFEYNLDGGSTEGHGFKTLGVFSATHGYFLERISSCGIEGPCGLITERDGILDAITTTNRPIKVSAVPVPGAVWLLSSSIIGLLGMRKIIKSSVLPA